MELPGFVKRLIGKLEQAGFEAWAVGGCVRDALLQKKPEDYDVCTNARPDEIKAALAGLRILDTGLPHGTLTVLTAEAPVEVTAYRAESGYRDGRHPDKVDFIDEITGDLARRDFTVNAMAYHPQRGLKDPFYGRQDLRAGIIRCVGDPEKRLHEDGLRIMRALRFSSQLDFCIEKKTAAALLAEKHRLAVVSSERLSVELCKLLTGAGAGRVLAQWPQVLGVFLPDLLPAVNFLQHSRYHHLDVWGHTAAAVNAAAPVLAVRLALLFHDIGKPDTFMRGEDGAGHFYGHAEKSAELAAKAFERLCLPSKLKREVISLVRLHDRPIESTERAVRRALSKYGEDFFFLLLEVKKGDGAAHAPHAAAQRLQELARLEELARGILREKQCFTLKDMAVGGDDLIQAGFIPGMKMGRILQALLEQVVDGTLKNDRESLLRAARGLDLKP